MIILKVYFYIVVENYPLLRIKLNKMRLKKSLLLMIVLCTLTMSCSNNTLSTDGHLLNDSTLLNNDTTYAECSISQWRDGKEKAVVFTWDDNMAGAKAVADLFSEHGLQATFFLNTACFLNWKFNLLYPRRKAMFEEILNEGHEIGTHSHNNVNLLSIPRSRVESELVESSKTIHSLFGYIPSTMSHPTSHYDEYVDSVMALYYLDSRYSVLKDRDSTIRYMQIRTDYDFVTYKKNLDSFFESSATRYVYGGHQLDDEGYQPIKSEVLEELLTYIQSKYSEACWITTFENMTMYHLLRSNIKFVNTPGRITIDCAQIKKQLKRYTHADACITLCFKNRLLDFYSDGLVNTFYRDGNSFITIDIRKANVIKYSSIDKLFEPQSSMRGL